LIQELLSKLGADQILILVQAKNLDRIRIAVQQKIHQLIKGINDSIRMSSFILLKDGKARKTCE